MIHACCYLLASYFYTLFVRKIVALSLFVRLQWGRFDYVVFISHSSLKQVVTEAQMVLTVAYNKATSKFYSFYGRFMMSAARLTAGMLTQAYQWHLHLEGRDRNMLAGPHTQRQRERTETLRLRLCPGWIAAAHH